MCSGKYFLLFHIEPARATLLLLLTLQMDAIPADFFSDLVPIKPNGSREPAAPKPGALQTDAVLPSRPDASSPSAALDAAGRSDLAGMHPMGDSRLRREVKEFEGATQAVVESILQRFADGLKGLLEDTNRSAPAMRTSCSASVSKWCLGLPDK